MPCTIRIIQIIFFRYIIKIHVSSWMQQITKWQTLEDRESTASRGCWGFFLSKHIKCLASWLQFGYALGDFFQQIAQPRRILRYNCFPWCCILLPGKVKIKASGLHPAVITQLTNSFTTWQTFSQKAGGKPVVYWSSGRGICNITESIL